MRIFITGGTGFIGRHVVDQLLEEDHHLLLLTRNQVSYRPEKVRILQGDLGHRQQLKNDLIQFDPEVCLHLAWEGIPDLSYTFSKLNLDHSLSLINMILQETHCKKIVISGSCFEYGKRKGVCRETDELESNSDFTWAKNALYRYGNMACHINNVDLIWFRIFYVYGHGQRGGSLMPSLVKRFNDGCTPDIKSPFNANDFIHVSDVAKAMKIASEKNIGSGIYNLGSGRSVKIKDVSRIVEKVVTGATTFSEQLGTGVPPQETFDFWADMQKTKTALNWQPQKPLEDGIEEFIREEATI